MRLFLFAVFLFLISWSEVYSDISKENTQVTNVEEMEKPFHLGMVAYSLAFLIFININLILTILSIHAD